MSANPVGHVALKFIDKSRDMVPQNMFSTVRTGGKKVQLVVISGLDFIDIAVVYEYRMKVLRKGLICKFVENIHALNVKNSI